MGKFPAGVLQKFIDPIGDKNSKNLFIVCSQKDIIFNKMPFFEALIQALWSPHVCIQSKRRNYQSLYNHKLNIYEKCCTYDGPEFFSEAGIFEKHILINK